MSSGHVHKYQQTGFWQKKVNQYWNAPDSQYSEKSKKELDEFAKRTKKDGPFK